MRVDVWPPVFVCCREAKEDSWVMCLIPGRLCRLKILSISPSLRPSVPPSLRPSPLPPPPPPLSLQVVFAAFAPLLEVSPTPALLSAPRQRMRSNAQTQRLGGTGGKPCVALAAPHHGETELSACACVPSHTGVGAEYLIARRRLMWVPHTLKRKQKHPQAQEHASARTHARMHAHPR